MYLDPNQPYVLVNQLEAQALLRTLDSTHDYGFSLKEWQSFQDHDADQIISQLKDAARSNKYGDD